MAKIVKAKGNAKSSNTVQFKFRNETPGAVRYQEVDEKGKERSTDEDGAVIGTLYFRKAGAFPDGKYPKALTVTITA